MAPTRRETQDSHHKAPAKLADAEDTLQTLALLEATLENLLDSTNEYVERLQRGDTAALQALGRLDQTLIQHDLPKSTAQELLGPMEDSDDLAAIEKLASSVEVIEEVQSEIRAFSAMNEEIERLRQEAYGITRQIHDMLDAKVLPNTASNNTGNLVAECRLHTVTASRFQASCSVIGSNEVWVHEFGHRDMDVMLAVIRLGIFAGALGISFAATALLCAVLRLLGGPQVRACGMIWLAVAAACCIVCLVGV